MIVFTWQWISTYTAVTASSRGAGRRWRRSRVVLRRRRRWRRTTVLRRSAGLSHLTLVVVGILLLRLSRRWAGHAISCHHRGITTVRRVGVFLRVLGVVSGPSCVDLLLLRCEHGSSSSGLSCDWGNWCRRRLRTASVASRSL